MRAARLAAVLLAVVGGVLAVPRAAGADPATAGGPVVVPSDGSTVTTPRVTVTGRLYQVTVTGVFSHNGGPNLGDCGWWNPPAEGDAWVRGGFLTVNGATARCASDPYTTTHTYTWTQPGTGAPFAFRLTDGSPANNVGALVADVVEVSGPPEVEGDCATLAVDVPSGSLKAVHVELRATASGGTGVGFASASCEFRDASGEVVATVQTKTAGPYAYATDVVLLAREPHTACLFASAFFLVDGVTATDSECKTIA